jgi:hypothetical protein
VDWFGGAYLLGGFVLICGLMLLAAKASEAPDDEPDEG